MTKGSFPVESFRKMETPFYYYDTQLLAKTLQTIKEEAARHEGFAVHYAVKANANPKVLRLIASYGMGADCVSGGEIKAALDAGFSAKGIVYAGVGKKDWEKASFASTWRVWPSWRSSTTLPERRAKWPTSVCA